MVCVSVITPITIYRYANILGSRCYIIILLVILNMYVFYALNFKGFMDEIQNIGRVMLKNKSKS
jgi:hypothetical protein